MQAELSSEIMRLKDLVSQVSEIASSFDRAIESGRCSGDKARAVDNAAVLAMAKRMYSFRQKRAECLPADLFADPAWDILLELYIMKMENRPVRVKNACIASGVPPTTALRWIRLLEESELIVRSADSCDQRVRWVELTPKAFEAMDDLLRSHIQLEHVRPGHPGLAEVRSAAGISR